MTITMKTITICTIFFLVTFSLHAGPGEINAMASGTMGIGIENEGKTLVMVFDDNSDRKLHTVIDLTRANDLEYKTRIMRYFGGMLKNDTYKFEQIQVISGEEHSEMEFNRTNVSMLINSILAQIEK